MKTKNKTMAKKNEKSAELNEEGKIEKSGSRSKKTTGHVVLKKITMKPLQSLPMDATMRLAGIVVRTEKITTNYGESTRFIGDFAAIMPDGSTLRAGSAYLPRQAEGLVEAGLAAHMNDEHFKGVEFAIEIGKEPGQTKTGYNWTVKTLVGAEPTEDKVLALLGG